jgi:hypothetical protein
VIVPIVSNTIASSQQPDGSTNNVLRMYDQDATEYMVTFHAPASFNLQAKIDNTIAGMDEQLAEAEFQSLIGL